MTKSWFVKQMLLVILLAIVALKTAQAVEVIPGELIVKFKDGVTKSLRSSLKSDGLSVIRDIKLSTGDLHVVSFDATRKSAYDVADLLKKRNDVAYAEPNYVWRVITPLHDRPFISSDNSKNYSLNDPRFDKLWGFQNTGANDPMGAPGVAGIDINVLPAWEVTNGSRDVKIAVIDTGIDYTHPDLASNIWTNEVEANGLPGVDDDNNGFVDDVHGYNFSEDNGDPRDGHNHGTHCAGTIGAVHNNGLGVAGVMGNVQLVAVKFLSNSGSGTTETAIRSIDYATRIGVDIMSNSWGGGAYSEALKEAIEQASKAGIIFVAAAGNSSNDNDLSPTYPANYEVPNVVAVASHDANGNLSLFSCYGKKTVHLAAPGNNILSSVRGGGYQVFSGTSMAAPHVSGALGLLVAHVGRMPHEMMKERLIATTSYIPLYKPHLSSSGRLNVYNLLTDFRPLRPIQPEEDLWETVDLAEAWESAHPYTDDLNLSRTITVPGAKMIRVIIRKYDLEKRYDYLTILGSDDLAVDIISGKGENLKTELVQGDTVKLRFHSDATTVRWGFLVDQVQVIYNLPEKI